MFKIKHKCLIYDTTLRDGEQMPGVVFSPEQKLDLAYEASRFNVDYMDIMPVISETEAGLSRVLLETGLREKLVAATMLRESHVDVAAELGFKHIILFTPVSDIHLRHKLGTTHEENKDRSQELVEYAKARGLRVAFAAEDATRTDPAALIDFMGALGNLEYFMPCDTLGCLTPQASKTFYGGLVAASDVKIGLHVHNDFGLATANTLAGIEAGAAVFSGTFTGIGERAGNAPIEEVCTALKYMHGVDLGVRFRDLTWICGKVSAYSKMDMQKHKPIIGENVFRHESGIHVDGVLKNPLTYENFNPADIGQKRKIMYGKHSGKAVIRSLLERNNLPASIIRESLAMIKQYSAENKRSLTEQEALQIIRKALPMPLPITA